MTKKFITYSELTQNKSTDFKQIGKVSTESVFKNTKKHWKEWIQILDRVGANSWSYQEIVTYLKNKQRLSFWWQHGVALGFEIATGRRKAGQDSNGKYMATTTKTIPVSASDLWKFIISNQGLKTWLNPLSPIVVKPGTQFETQDGFFGEIRTLKKPRRLRMFWKDSSWEAHTTVELVLVQGPKNKSMLIVNHTGLLNPNDKTRLRTRWRNCVDKVGESLEDKKAKK